MNTVLLVGCMSLGPTFSVEHPSLARALPENVKRTDFVRYAEYGKGARTEIRITVESELARLGAYVGRDGKIYDRHDRPVAFFRQPCFGGPPVDPSVISESLQRADEQLRELQKSHTVIVISHDPADPIP